MKSEYKSFIVAIGILFFTLCGLNAQQLYVGTNYHPHDVSPEQWESDIKLMKEAGFTVVRMGHLAWDSYEPEDGKFTFEWFDKVMDMMAEANIKVILDVAVRPAPLWLHKKCPSVNVVDADGHPYYPNNRYYQDSGDPMYQEHALRYTDAISKRYANHPALLAFGIDNELSCGKISYSENVRLRFIDWVKAKYGTTEKLNQAWAGQRWSRRISDFDEIGLPINGAPERTLDFRRFLSDELNGFYFKMIDVINRNAPKALTNSNAWYYAPQKHYDYAPMAYSGRMTREGNGFYPGSSLLDNGEIRNSLFGIARIQYEATTPFWCNEFTTMTATPNAIRKYAYMTLMYGNQMVCGWTWQAMHGGEEQFLQGMMDWDGMTNGKYDEYKQLAGEFKKIEKYFPYQVKADVALASSFPSQMVKGYKAYISTKHDSQLEKCFNVMYDRNMDVRVVDVSRSALDYKVLVVPGMAVMDETSANKIRAFVKNGGTVIMTANSAILDETGQVFRNTLPGRLSDVFGIRIGGYGETKAMNEVARLPLKDSELMINYNGQEIKVSSSQFDRITGKGAKVLGNIISLDKDYPVITSHSYGKGTAIYVGVTANENLIGTLVDELVGKLSLKKGPDVPKGVCARQIDDKHVLMFNTTTKPVIISLKGKAKSLLNDVDYVGNMVIKANEPEFIEYK